MRCESKTIFLYMLASLETIIIRLETVAVVTFIIIQGDKQGSKSTKLLGLINSSWATKLLKATSTSTYRAVERFPCLPHMKPGAE